MPNSTNEYDPYLDFSGPSYVPHKADEVEALGTNHLQEEDAVETQEEIPNVIELITDLDMLVKAQQELSLDTNLRHLTELLRNYQSNIVWHAPKTPFPMYSHMTPKQKVCWWLMLIVANNGDKYGTNVGEFVSVFDDFLAEFFPHANGDVNKLTREDEAALMAQLGIGQFILSHSSTFLTRYNEIDPRFSNEDR